MMFALPLSQSTDGVIGPSSCKIYKFIFAYLHIYLKLNDSHCLMNRNTAFDFRKQLNERYQAKLKFLFAALPPVHSDTAAGLFVFMSDCITEYSTGGFDAFCK